MPRQLLWSPQLVWQSLPGLQRNVQSPPGQVNVQLAPSLQVMSQPPPAQSWTQVACPLHVKWQPPWSHVALHLDSPLQLCEQSESRQISVQSAELVQVPVQVAPSLQV